MKRLFLLLMLAIAAVASGPLAADDGRIRVSREFPRYWEYKGQTVLLLGGSVEDNLFQTPDLEAHLDLLRSVGGNYVRNTMSSRDEGDVWPFHRREDGRYDLERSGEEYWRRFELLLRLARERDVIVQIELWDRFDFAREPWQDNPYNPKNNVNYTEAESGLATAYPRHPGSNDNPFFRSVPELDDNRLLLRYQQAQVDRMLSISLSYPNVLYCMDNETSGRPEWGAYWATRIRAKAADAGVEVHTTEMWDPWDLSHALHRHTFDHPDLYTFVDVSQNNHQKGQAHWDNFQRQWRRIAERPRPLNNVKVYGADTGRYGTDRDGSERFWRNVIGGAASARFHRPDSGLGLSEAAQSQIKSARMLADAMNLFSCEPGHGLLSERGENEAYLTSQPGRQYAVYFPDGGSVRLDLSHAQRTLRLRWLDGQAGRWSQPKNVPGGGTVELAAPGSGHWVALLVTAD